MHRSARNVAQRALLLMSTACGSASPSGETSWFALELHGVPIGAESWEDAGDGSWNRTLELHYLVEGVARRATLRESCARAGESLSCPSGTIRSSAEGIERRRPVAGPPTGPPREILSALVIPAEMPPHPVDRHVFEVGGERRVVVAADRLEIPPTHRDRFDRWVREAEDVAPEEGPAAWAAGGACVHRAVAVVRLARRAGYVAELVTGRVLRDGALGPGLYPHAWAEIVADGRAWPIDPGLGLVPAGAGHLPLARGAETPRLELSVVVVTAPRRLDPPPFGR